MSDWVRLTGPGAPLARLRFNNDQRIFPLSTERWLEPDSQRSLRICASSCLAWECCKYTCMPGGGHGEVKEKKKRELIPTEPRSICLITVLWNPITHPTHPQNDSSVSLMELNLHPKIPHRGRHFPRCNHSWSLFMCFVYCCRELSYNQIEHLPSFYRCSSLQEMWEIRPSTSPHAYRMQHCRLCILYTVCVRLSQQRPAA